MTETLSEDPRPLPTDDPAEVEAETDLRPVVAGREGRSPLLLSVGVAALVGVVVFLFLSSQRDEQLPEAAALVAPGGSAMGPAASAAPPPDLTLVQPAVQPVTAAGPIVAQAPYVPAPPYNPPPSPPIYIQAPPGPPTAPTTSPAQRRAAPTLVVDMGVPVRSASGPGTAETPAAIAASRVAGANAAGAEDDPAQMAGLAGGEESGARADTRAPPAARASMLRNQSLTVPQGALIPGVLETALNSDLPGFARAVVSRDVRSFDGSQVLIPKGSRVIGEYKSGLAAGQSRTFIIWSRIIRPDGASIQIASNGTDDLGRAGLTGQVDRKFFQRFGGALLTSVLAAGVRGSGPTTSINIGSATQNSALAGAVSPGSISPTIRVPQGSPIRIFVARDLDFSPVGGSR